MERVGSLKSCGELLPSLARYQPTRRIDTFDQLRELASNAVEAILPPRRKLALLAQIEQYRQRTKEIPIQLKLWCIQAPD